MYGKVVLNIMEIGQVVRGTDMGFTLIQMEVNTLENGLIAKRRVMESKNGWLLIFNINNYI